LPLGTIELAARICGGLCSGYDYEYGELLDLLSVLWCRSPKAVLDIAPNVITAVHGHDRFCEVMIRFAEEHNDPAWIDIFRERFYATGDGKSAEYLANRGRIDLVWPWYRTHQDRIDAEIYTAFTSRLGLSDRMLALTHVINNEFVNVPQGSQYLTVLADAGRIETTIVELCNQIGQSTQPIPKEVVEMVSQWPDQVSGKAYVTEGHTTTMVHKFIGTENVKSLVKRMAQGQT
jgi:hypothetical protein